MTAGPLDQTAVTCEELDHRDLLAGYVAGDLTDDDRDALEAHVIECGTCAEAVRALLVARQEIAAAFPSPTLSRYGRILPWVAAAAVFAGAIVVSRGGIHLRDSAKPSRSAAALSVGSAAPAAGAVPESHPPLPRAVAQLALVEPPPYTPFTVRGGDELTVRFEDAMAAYAAGDFTRARDELHGIVSTDPAHVPAQFYLGVSLMMTDAPAKAAERFRSVLAAGNSPFRESSRILLAKALMRSGDVAGARRELEVASGQVGARAREASVLLQQLNAAQRSGG